MVLYAVKCVLTFEVFKLVESSFYVRHDVNLKLFDTYQKNVEHRIDNCFRIVKLSIDEKLRSKYAQIYIRIQPPKMNQNSMMIFTHTIWFILKLCLCVNEFID